MAKDFKKIKVETIKDNVFKLIGSDWMLITAGDEKKFNMMTASWGGLGILWGKPACFCVIRPTRYTYQLMEKSEYFTLSFFTEKFRDTLNFCGTKSGRDVDKVAKSGLTPVFHDKTSVYFKEARLVMVCRKLYFHDINPSNFIDMAIDKNYPSKDYHRMYVGEIASCIAK